ncbi:MAG: hypothetical protein HY904_07010 [Deltaproteobacteria bacterium]|nr:hypothetical protein [Deltaproteobacteria bacterium]
MGPLAILLCLAAAPTAERLFSELDVGLPGRGATAVALSPVDDRVLLVAVDGMLFRSGDGGETFDLVLRPGRRQEAAGSDALLAAEDAADESFEDGTASADDVTPDEFQPDLDPDEVDSALQGLQEDLQERLEADRTATPEGALPEGDTAAATAEPRLPIPQQLPGIRRIRFIGPDVVMVASHRGLFRSVDTGNTFEPLDLPRDPRIRNVRDVAAAPFVPTFLVAVTAGGTLQSRDGGVSWLPAPGTAGRTSGLSVAVGPGEKPVVAVGTPHGLLRSTDMGLTYEPVALPGEGSKAVTSLAMDADAERLYAVTPTLLFAGGLSARLLAPVGATWRNGLVVVHAEPGRANELWGGGRPGVFTSSDGGRSADEVGPESMVRDVVDIAVGSRDKALVAVATAAGALLFVKLEKARTGIKPLEAFQLLVGQEPTPAEVAEWAVQHHRMDHRYTAAMLTRSRLAWLAPAVRLTVVPPGVGNYGTTGTGTLADARRTQSQRQMRDEAYVYGLLQWDLPNLGMRPEEVRVFAEHKRLVDARERVWRKTLRVYEERRRLQADMIVRSSRNAVTLARKRLKLERLTSLLDALTGGRFTLEARRRGAPGDGVSISAPAGAGHGKH